MVITRFAPSPTGMLHIGSARTALFSYFYAKRFGGKFRLRIEDTDKERSTQGSVDAIINGMSWLGIKHDDEIIMQSSRINRHVEATMQMIKSGNAYYAYDDMSAIEKEREDLHNNGKPYRYNPIWRDGNLSVPENIKPCVRIKIPQGVTIVSDDVHGDVEFQNSEIEDFVILRSDGTPTYMLAVVIDDIDMGITNIIRGDDHLTNTPKQIMIYNAMCAKVPKFAHIPLIHGEDGKKLSKRRNPVAISDYDNMGILPEAMRSYLMNLGWSGQGNELLSDEEISRIFDTKDIGKSAARFDMSKLLNTNLHFINKKSDQELIDLIAKKLDLNISKEDKNRLLKIIPELKKSSTLKEIASMSVLYFVDAKIVYQDDAREIILSQKDKLRMLLDFISNECDYNDFDVSFKAYLAKSGFKFSEMGPVLRSALIGIAKSTSLVAIVKCLDKEICVQRIKNAINYL